MLIIFCLGESLPPAIIQSSCFYLKILGNVLAGLAARAWETWEHFAQYYAYAAIQDAYGADRQPSRQVVGCL
jgi:hypothetical protein